MVDSEFQGHVLDEKFSIFSSRLFFNQYYSLRNLCTKCNINHIFVRSVFSKFAIHPLKDVNFGPMIINIKKQRQFYIENHGDFEFRYSIVKVSNKGLIGQKPNNKQRGSTREGESGRTSSQLMLGWWNSEQNWISLRLKFLINFLSLGYFKL